VTAYVTNRAVTRSECPWLDEDVPAGKQVFRYAGHTCGCVGSGVACCDAAGETPFYELPADALSGPQGTGVVR
jgi:hypothetical protein